MKILYALTLCSVIFSCKPKPAPLLVYNIEMPQQTLNASGTRMIENIKTDTVMAINDTLAYDKAIRSFLAVKKAEKMLDYRVSKTNSFTVSDSSGVDLTNILSKNVVDSIFNKWAALNIEYKELLTIEN